MYENSGKAILKAGFMDEIHQWVFLSACAVSQKAFVEKLLENSADKPVLNFFICVCIADNRKEFSYFLTKTRHHLLCYLFKLKYVCEKWCWVFDLCMVAFCGDFDGFQFFLTILFLSAKIFKEWRALNVDKLVLRI